MRKQFDGVDVLLTCGVTCQVPVSRYDEGGPLLPWRLRTITVDDSPWEVGKNEPVEVGLVGDVKANLAALAAAVADLPPDDELGDRRRTAEARCRDRLQHWSSRVEQAREAGTLSAELVAAELRELLPADAIFVDESISNRPAFVNTLQFRDPLAYFNVNGLSLGYSAAAAVGIQQALPHRRVVNVVGDGSLMYYPQAMWNAAVAGAPVLFVVLNNSSYRVLKVIIERMGGPWGADKLPVPGLQLDGSQIDFVRLAAALGVPAECAASPAELRSALERGLAATGPYLVEVDLRQQ
jgi:benzoylformate decarboxylase